MTVTVQPGLFPYTYNWGSGFVTQNSITGLTGGNYTMTISDGLCDTIVPYIIQSPPPFIVRDSMKLATCAGGRDGELHLSVSGSTPPYTYLWSTGSTSTSITGQSIGTYMVTITDANNCLSVNTLRIRELELALDSSRTILQPPLCTGDANGTITLQMGNGLPPYEYDWNDGTGFVLNKNSKTGLPEGVYTIDVRDGNGCRGNFVVNLRNPSPLAILMDSVDVSCFGLSDGIAIANVSGGVGSYRYIWSPTGQTTSSATGLPAGTYSVTVTDDNGCTIADQITVRQPPVLIIDSIRVRNVLCYGGSDGTLEIFASGGVPSYNYSLDGRIYQSNALFTGQKAGTYTLYVQDASGCISSLTATITQPLQLIVNAGADQTIDLGYSANLSAVHTPTASVVTYSWTPANTLSCSDCRSPVASPPRTTTYAVQVTDPNGCTATDSVTVIVRKYRPIFIPNAFTPNED
jgi:hypothetical protein